MAVHSIQSAARGAVVGFAGSMCPASRPTKAINLRVACPSSGVSASFCPACSDLAGFDQEGAFLFCFSSGIVFDCSVFFALFRDAVISSYRRTDSSRSSGTVLHRTVCTHDHVFEVQHSIRTSYIRVYARSEIHFSDIFSIVIPSSVLCS